MIPNRLLKELGESAARFNMHTTEHASGCCSVCRRFLRDLWQAMTDESNWQPEPVTKRLERLQGEIDMIRSAQMENTAKVQSAAAQVIAPMNGLEDEPQGAFFTPPLGRHEDE